MSAPATPATTQIGRRVVFAVVLLVAVVAGFSLFADVRKLSARLGDFAPLAVVAALGLAAGNYVIRFLRWQLYLRRVGGQAPLGVSALTFVAGFSMSVTPGKVGELLKAVLLRDAAGVPVARTAPVVIAERVTDLVALVVLGLAGVTAYGVGRTMVIAATAVVLVVLGAIAYRPLATAILDMVERLGPLGKLVPRLREIHHTLADLVRPWPLLWGTTLAIAAWLCECVGFALIVRGFAGADVAWGLAILIYAATTVAGALSFLPGGLLVTEASMTLMLVRSAHGVDEPTAIAATILTRLCTLWFAVLIGFIALGLIRRRTPTPAKVAP
jgi:uncharacterized protein (TIRG00374 family)